MVCKKKDKFEEFKEYMADVGYSITDRANRQLVLHQIRKFEEYCEKEERAKEMEKRINRVRSIFPALEKFAKQYKHIEVNFEDIFPCWERTYAEDDELPPKSIGKEVRFRFED